MLAQLDEDGPVSLEDLQGPVGAPLVARFEACVVAGNVVGGFFVEV